LEPPVTSTESVPRAEPRPDMGFIKLRKAMSGPMAPQGWGRLLLAGFLLLTLYLRAADRLQISKSGNVAGLFGNWPPDISVHTGKLRTVVRSKRFEREMARITPKRPEGR